jgi:hypothetical protein
MNAALRVFVWSSAGLALFAAGFALGQQTAPKDYRGVQEEVLGTIDLAREISSIDDRELRVSRATVAPGRPYRPPQSPGRSDDRLCF